MKRSDRAPILPQADLGYLSEHDPTTPARRMVIAMPALLSLLNLNDFHSPRFAGL